MDFYMIGVLFACGLFGIILGLYIGLSIQNHFEKGKLKKEDVNMSLKDHIGNKDGGYLSESCSDYGRDVSESVSGQLKTQDESYSGKIK